ncbi:ParB/RepB/Spo0J family partition protein [Nocardiopsis dassonvillei]
MHRLRAAQLRGQTEIKAKFFDGPESDAFLLAVESNTRHGLPLTLADKTAAAQRLIKTHPHWSDRAIAAATALSATKIGGLRNEASSGEQLTARLGQDGKLRPVSTEEGRRIAGRLLSETPYAPLREIARKAGISPGTVRDVRARVLRGEDPVPRSIRALGKRRKPESRTEDYRRTVARGNDGSEAAVDLDTLFQNLCRDPSLRHSELGRLLLRMLDVQLTGARRSSTIAEAIPEHRLEMVSLAAIECARSWQAFAERLELRRVRH